MTTYWIINQKKKTYIKAVNPSFDGEWKENFPNTRGEEWENVSAERMESYDSIDGIFFTYSLGQHGGYFTMFCDTDEHTKDDIKKAKQKLKQKRDVVHLNVMRLSKFQNSKPGRPKKYTVRLTEKEINAIWCALGNFITYGLSLGDEDMDNDLISAESVLRKIKDEL